MGDCSKNITQGGKTFGLNRLECLNSNGLPPLNSKFKDLNLQLHASTTVINPYTFNIQGNTSFSTSIEADVATYQIKCGESVIRGVGITAIGYSSIGFADDKSFGNLDNKMFKNATISSLYVILYSTTSPIWIILLNADVGDTITLETLKNKVIIPKSGKSDGLFRYELDKGINPNWSNNTTYELKLS